MTMPSALKPAPLTRFDKTRADAAESAAITLACEVIAGSTQTMARCVNLLIPAKIAGALGNVVNKAEVSRALSGVIRDLQEVVSELGE